MSVFPTYMHAYNPSTWYTKRSKEVVRSPATGVIGGCKTPYGCWELNWGPL